MLEDLVKIVCQAAPRSFKPCGPADSVSSWILTEGGQLFASTLLGAVVGAAVAGIIQFLISRAEFKRNMRQSASEHRRVRRLQAAEQLQRNKTLALQIGVKAMTLTNQMYSTIGLILRSVDDAKESGLESTVIADKMVPMSGISRDALEFSSDELAFLFWSKEAELANKLMLLNEKNRSLTDSIITYSEYRIKFPEVITTKNADLIKIRQLELQNLADAVCQGLQEDFVFLLNIMEEIPSAFDRAFKQDAFFKAVIPGGGRERLATFTEILKAHNIEVVG
ncbi:hypothetical protein DXT90_18300 [Agrobacterium tumefaciens]|nr:hypothetical protein [Agrobacterium tumefaciens]